MAAGAAAAAAVATWVDVEEVVQLCTSYVDADGDCVRDCSCDYGRGRGCGEEAGWACQAWVAKE